MHITRSIRLALAVATLVVATGCQPPTPARPVPGKPTTWVRDDGQSTAPCGNGPNPRPCPTTTTTTPACPEPEPTNHVVSVEILVQVDAEGRYKGVQVTANGEQGPVTDMPYIVAIGG